MNKAATCLFVFFLLMKAPDVLGQTFSDDFEGYNAGDYLAVSSPKWLTWDQDSGSPDDVQIVDTRAFSGSKSIYFKADSADGGPDDIVLPFDSAYLTGDFVISFMLYIPSDNGAYFNFQADEGIGETWALNCQMVDNGDLHLISPVRGPLLKTTFPHDTWFQVQFQIDLNTNSWEFYLDSTHVGTIQNGTNRIASLDLYPVNQNFDGNGKSEFWVDDVHYQHTGYTAPLKNAAVSFVHAEGLATQHQIVTARVRNLGSNNISSFEVEVDYITTQFTETVQGIFLEPLEEYEIMMSQKIQLGASVYPLSVSLTKVNGSFGDHVPSDNTKTVEIDPIVPAMNKLVVVESATGTGCEWCPESAVVMKHLLNEYEGFVAGIAVHNNDPMEHSGYSAGISGKVTELPSAFIDRGEEIELFDAEEHFLEKITTPPKCKITNGAKFNDTTRTLQVSVTYHDFATYISGDYRVACALTEDNVSGTSPGFAQVNGYAGGDNGSMGGFENLADTIPAGQMFYDNVLRSIVPSYEGEAVFVSGVNGGITATVNFNFTVENEWELSQMHIVGMLVAPDGSIDNGSFSTVSKAQANGFIESGTVLGRGQNTLEKAEHRFSVFPNPSDNEVYIRTNLSGGTVLVTDLTGKQLFKMAVPVSGEVMLTKEQAPRGVYLITLFNVHGEQVESKKLIRY